MAITPWLANYPWSDPIFQEFTVQQYLTVSGVNPSQTYTLKAPVEHEAVEAPAEPVKPEETPAAEPEKTEVKAEVAEEVKPAVKTTGSASNG